MISFDIVWHVLCSTYKQKSFRKAITCDSLLIRAEFDESLVFFLFLEWHGLSSVDADDVYK